MRVNLTSLVVSLIFLVGLTGNAIAVEYDHETEVRGMTFSWKVADGNLHVKLMGKTTGWVGIGFNPTEGMKDANYVLGYVKKGKVEITDDFGNSAINHKSDEELGGTNDVTVVGGEEKGRATTLEFSIPLDSGDKYDSVLDPEGTTVVLLAFGGNRDSFRSKHRANAIINVNLSTGEVQ
ncbi:MAG: DOMON domain-containing protein [Desulfocapsaceae bacterium]|nr:DOMON domain-containing protein [Desulfocapsaceae bacterium]